MDRSSADRPEPDLDVLLGRLVRVSRETPEEHDHRWPYNAKVEIDSAGARTLLDYIRKLQASRV